MDAEGRVGALEAPWRDAANAYNPAIADPPDRTAMNLRPYRNHRPRLGRGVYVGPAPP